MGIYQQSFTLPFTHLRVLAARMSPAAAVLEIARAEIVLDDERIAHDAPYTVCLKNPADEGSGPHRFSDTPLLLAQTLWTPGPPHVLAAYDPSIWALFPGALLGRIARLDVRRLVQQVWPNAPIDNLAAVIQYLGVDKMMHRVPTRAPESTLQCEVRQCMALLTTIYTVQGGTVSLLRDTVLGPQPRWMAELLGPQAPDAILQAMVDVAGLPLDVEAAALPDLRASDETWAAVPVDNLVWIAGQHRLPQDLRGRADAELGRRLREQAGCRPPGLILRQIGMLARI